MKLQKRILYIAAISIVGIAVLQSCKKTALFGTTDVAALNMVNALPNSVPLIPVIGTGRPVRFPVISGVPQYGSYQTLGTIGTISYGSNVLFTTKAGMDTVYAVQKNADTLTDIHGEIIKKMYGGVLNLAGNTTHSLFITGADTTAPDFLFVQDILPYHSKTDSTTGIRFVNLSANSNPVSVNISGQANGSEVNSLSYKGITTFKNYAATSSISSYKFVFRNAATGDSLTSYTLSGVNGGTTTVANTVRFKNFTIALIGQPGGSGGLAQKCILVNNY